MIEATVFIPLVIVAITEMIKMGSPQVHGWVTILVAFLVAIVVSVISLVIPPELTGIPEITVGSAIYSALVAVGISASFKKASGN